MRSSRRVSFVVAVGAVYLRGFRADSSSSPPAVDRPRFRDIDLPTHEPFCRDKAGPLKWHQEGSGLAGYCEKQETYGKGENIVEPWIMRVSRTTVKC